MASMVEYTRTACRIHIASRFLPELKAVQRVDQRSEGGTLPSKHSSTSLALISSRPAQNMFPKGHVRSAKLGAE